MRLNSESGLKPFGAHQELIQPAYMTLPNRKKLRQPAAVHPIPK